MSSSENSNTSPIVTKAGVESLEQQRAIPQSEMHYTIGGGIETVIHSARESEREAQIVHGKETLTQASNDVRNAFVAGQPDARTEYIRQQREAARGAPSRNRTKSR